MSGSKRPALGQAVAGHRRRQPVLAVATDGVAARAGEQIVVVVGVGVGRAGVGQALDLEIAVVGEGQGLVQGAGLDHGSGQRPVVAVGDGFRAGSQALCCGAAQLIGVIF